MARTPESSAIGINGVDNIIEILAAHPTKAMCDDLHRRYGPWIRVTQGAVVPAAQGT